MLEQLEDRLTPSSVSGVSPNYGPIAGDSPVAIYGGEFTGATLVTFGGVAAPDFDVMSATEIMAQSPVHSADVVNVVVTAPSGVSPITSADQYDYLASTTTTLASSANKSTYGQSITLTVTVSNGGQGAAPTGQVDVLDGANVIGTATLSGGQATLVTSALTEGGHPLSAAYQGDEGDEGDAVSTSNMVGLMVQQASTTTTLTSSADPSNPGQAVTLTAEVDGVSGGAPTGTITFMSGTTTLGTATLSPGGNGSQATLTLSTLATGSTPITAVYGSGSNYGGSSSTTLNQVVQNNGAYVWTGLVSGDWDVAGNWTVNGMVPQYAPGLQQTQNADVIFNGVGETNVNSTTDGAVIVNSLTLDSAYTGTLSLVGTLNVAATFDLEGGAMSQPNGVGTSDITVMGAFNWVGGVLNSSNTLGNLLLNGGYATLGGANLSTGDNIELNVFFKTLNFNTTGSLTFTNINGGIGVASGCAFFWNGTANLVRPVVGGKGQIVNNGLFVVENLLGPSVTSALPFVNNGNLDIDKGTLVVTNVGQIGPSVAQAGGTLYIGFDLLSGATLEVDQGLSVTGGVLRTARGQTCEITGGNVTVTGGTIAIGGVLGIGVLKCSGLVTMTGGTYEENVNLGGGGAYDVWQSSTGFSFPAGNTAVLEITTVGAIPAVLPVGPFPILQTPAAGDITGDFATQTGLAIRAGANYTAAPDGTNQNYDLTP